MNLRMKRTSQRMMIERLLALKTTLTLSLRATPRREQSKMLSASKGKAWTRTSMGAITRMASKHKIGSL